VAVLGEEFEGPKELSAGCFDRKAEGEEAVGKETARFVDWIWEEEGLDRRRYRQRGEKEVWMGRYEDIQVLVA
jgi:hypothetical protein